MLVDEGIYRYIEAKERKLRPNTMEGYMSAIKCHVSPRWSGRDFEGITQAEVQEWVDGFELAGAARKAFYTFRQVVRWLLSKQLIRMVATSTLGTYMLICGMSGLSLWDDTNKRTVWTIS